MTSENRPRIYDISPLLSSRIGVFPGDVSFERRCSMDFSQGHHLRLSSISSTLHLGAHADAPNHYASEGVSIADRDPAFYLGRCLVLHADAPRGARINLSHFSRMWQNLTSWPAPRIIVSSGSFPDPDQWNSDFCSFDPGLIEVWAKAGVRLIGIDTPSIDPEDSKALEAHQMVARYDLAVLEGLVLREVPEGLYTLIAPPLKIEGADAAPLRALLIEGPDRLG